MDQRPAFGSALRDWRQRRGVSQLDLALDAGISARHLAFLETGRAKPSRDMVGQLSDALDVPLRLRNDLLLSAGFAPQFSAYALDHAALAPVLAGLDRLLERHAPWPGFLLDHDWNVLKANKTAALLLEGIGGDPAERNLLTRLATSPSTSDVIENWGAVGAEFAARLKAEMLRSGDMRLKPRLDTFLASLPPDAIAEADPSPLLSIHIRHPSGARLSLFSAIGQFNAARDITTADLRIELFFPADAATEQFLDAV